MIVIKHNLKQKQELMHQRTNRRPNHLRTKRTRSGVQRVVLAVPLQIHRPPEETTLVAPLIRSWWSHCDFVWDMLMSP